MAATRRPWLCRLRNHQDRNGMVESYKEPDVQISEGVKQIGPWRCRLCGSVMRPICDQCGRRL